MSFQVYTAQEILDEFEEHEGVRIEFQCFLKDQPLLAMVQYKDIYPVRMSGNKTADDLKQRCSDFLDKLIEDNRLFPEHYDEEPGIENYTLYSSKDCKFYSFAGGYDHTDALWRHASKLENEISLAVYDRREHRTHFFKRPLQ